MRSRPTFLTQPVGVVIGTLAYVAVLHYALAVRIAPAYGYLGYQYVQPDWFGYSISVAMVCGLALVLPRRLLRPSHVIAWGLFVIAVVPSAIMPHLIGALDQREAAITSAWVCGCFFLVATLGTRRAVRGFMPRIRVSALGFWLAVATLSAVIYGYMALSVGLSLRLPGLSSVYDVRGDFKDELAGAGLLGYLIPLQAKVLNPLVILRGIYSGRWAWVAAGFLGQALIYTETGLKHVLFSTPALLLLALVFRASRRPPGAVLLYGAAALASVSLVVDWLTKSRLLTSLFVRRTLITPGLLTAAYVSVYDHLPKAHWGYSFLSGFTTDPNSLSPPYMVGSLFFGSPAMSANASLFADGYANLGHLGMLIEASVLVVLLWVIDDAARGIPVAVSGLLFLMPTIGMANTSVFTAMLTHGIAVAILLCLAAPRTGWGRRRPTRSRSATAASVSARR